MCKKTSFHVRVSSFRRRVGVWMLLTVFSCSFLPSLGVAQQSTATISALSGNVLVNGQKQDKGTVLSAGDVIETQAGASLVLALSDGSQLELGENTKVDIAVLSQTAIGARVSRIKLLWGWIRAKLSPGHQQAGSSFNIETPNALVGVKFSEPDIEVSYNLESVETVGIAHTVELMAKNLLTDEEVLVPVGSTVIITATTIKIVAGIVGAIGTSGTSSTSASSTGTGSSSTGSSGMGTGTKVALGIGAAAAAAGGIVAIVTNAGTDNSSSASFTGTFVADERIGSIGERRIAVINLTQNGTEVTGSMTQSAECSCCTASCTVPITGTVVDKYTAILTWPYGKDECGPCPEGWCYEDTFIFGTHTATLENNGRRLCSTMGCFNRQ